MKKDKRISITLETETYNEILALAVEDIRPVGNLIRYIIRLYIRGINDGTIQLSIYNMSSKRI